MSLTGEGGGVAAAVVHSCLRFKLERLMTASSTVHPQDQCFADTVTFVSQLPHHLTDWHAATSLCLCSMQIVQPPGGTSDLFGGLQWRIWY
jgi:hypothetical protein